MHGAASYSNETVAETKHPLLLGARQRGSQAGNTSKKGLGNYEGIGECVSDGLYKLSVVTLSKWKARSDCILNKDVLRAASPRGHPGM